MQKVIMLMIIAIFALISCNSPRNTNEQSIPEQQVEILFPKGKTITGKNFTGMVWLTMMGAKDSTLQARYGHITFAPKARTNWHSHPGGQILFITAGKGYYQAKGGPVHLLYKGDVVEIPRNVVHWHGAAPDSEFAHIAISLNSDEGGTFWLGPVTDEQYAELNRQKNE